MTKKVYWVFIGMAGSDVETGEMKIIGANIEK